MSCKYVVNNCNGRDKGKNYIREKKIKDWLSFLYWSLLSFKECEIEGFFLEGHKNLR